MKAWQKKKQRSKQRVIAASVKQDLDFATPLTKKETAKIKRNKRRNRKITASQFRAAYHQLREDDIIIAIKAVKAPRFRTAKQSAYFHRDKERFIAQFIDRVGFVIGDKDKLREIRDTLEQLDADVIDDLLRSLPAEVAAAYYGSDGNNTSDIPMFGDPEEVYNVIMDVIGGVRMV